MAQQKRIRLGTMRLQVQVRSLPLLSGLRIWHCHELWCRLQTWLGSCVAVTVAQASSYSSDQTPSLGISMCRRCGPKRKTKKKKTKKKNVLFDPISHSLDSTHRNKKHQHIKLCVQKCFLQCVFFFLGPNLQHMEVPRVGVESELQLQAYTTATATPCQSHIFDLHSDLQQCQILNPLTEARDQTHILTETTLCP